MKKKIMSLVAFLSLFIMCFSINVFAENLTFQFQVVESGEYIKFEILENISDVDILVIYDYAADSSFGTPARALFYSSDAFSVQRYNPGGSVSGSVRSASLDEASNLYYAVDTAYYGDRAVNNYSFYSVYDLYNTDLILHSLSDGSISSDPNYNPAIGDEFVESEAVKSADLGYIKIPNYDLANFQPSILDSGENSFIVNWANVSTTGFDLTQVDCYVESQGRMKYWVYDNIFSKNVKKTYYPRPNEFLTVSYELSSHLKATIGTDISAITHPLYSHWSDVRDQIGFFEGVGDYTTDFRFRIVYKSSNGWLYGPWLTSSKLEPGSDYVTEDEGGNVEKTPVDNVKVDENGSEIVSDDGSDGGMTSFLSVINNIKSSIGNIPTLIGELFTFLPSSIVALIAAGFALVLILRVLGR